MTVAVVGGGIVGMATAYFLRQRDVEVVVLERSNVGAGSTERAVGGIREQFSTPVNVGLSQASMEVWDTFEEEFGVDIEHRRIGYMFLAREEGTAEELRETAEMQRDLGVDIEVLDPAGAREHADVHDGNYRLATYGRRDGIADPHLALQGFSTAAQEAGTEVRTHTAVTDVVRDGARVAGVETDDGRVDAEYVVNAAGPWAGRVAAMAGLDLPISPQRRQVGVVAPEKPVPEDTPLTFDMDTGVYFLPDREGDALVGGHFTDPDERDPDRYPTDYDIDWAVEALERAADCAEYFGPEAGIRQGWSGLYAVTPDHHPIIEETLPGFVNAVGFSGHGFMHSPATGQLVTEMIVDGEPRSVDISALGTDRFEGVGAGREEKNVL
ncbi:FAD-dependent oxidoreductase [Halobacteriales archaeon QS_8_69_26]|nr:MAG: FAD-dependent oxidoreductase [Halobacteriales archaeon QS_8_69_26]